jgi:alkylhydroperoxidase/carboxymuconolactone decarboxylase family protein YurZ
MNDKYEVVTVSLGHCQDGLYLTPDALWIADHLMREALLPAVDLVCHRQQPLSHSYEVFADTVHDLAGIYASPKTWTVFPEDTQDIFQQYMAFASLSGTKSQLDYGLRSIIAVATNMYFAGAKIAEDSRWPTIIPKALAGHRVEALDEIDTALFTRILRVNPWLSWTQRLRAQFRRDQRILSILTKERFATGVRFYQKLANVIDTEIVAEQTRQRDRRAKRQTRRSILRAIKLYGQFYGTQDVQRFLAGKQLTFPGTRYDYRVRRSERSLFTATERRNTGITPVHLDIYQKGGAYLAPACLVFADTPVLDHLLHLRLMVQNAETEQKLLDALFVVGISNKLFDDPLAQEKRITEAEAAPTTMVNNIMLHNDSSDQGFRRHAISTTVYQHAHAALTEALRYPDGYGALLQKTARYTLGHYFDAIYGDNEDALRILNDILVYFHALPHAEISPNIAVAFRS